VCRNGGSGLREMLSGRLQWVSDALAVFLFVFRSGFVVCDLGCVIFVVVGFVR